MLQEGSNPGDRGVIATPGDISQRIRCHCLHTMSGRRPSAVRQASGHRGDRRDVSLSGDLGQRVPLRRGLPGRTNTQEPKKKKLL